MTLAFCKAFYFNKRLLKFILLYDSFGASDTQLMKEILFTKLYAIAAQLVWKGHVYWDVLKEIYIL